METFPAVKYSRLGGTEEQELPYTCNTSKTYGTSGSRHQIVHGHRNPLDVEKTVSAKTHYKYMYYSKRKKEPNHENKTLFRKSF